MSIERMKRVWLLVEAGELRKLLGLLAQHELMHVADLGKAVEESGTLGTVTTDVTEMDRRVGALQQALEVMNAFDKPTRRFEENFLPTPMEVTREEFDRAREELDEAGLVERLDALSANHSGKARRLEEVELELHTLGLFREADAEMPPTMKHCVGRLGVMVQRSYHNLLADEKASELRMASRLAAKDGAGMLLVEVVNLREDDEGVGELLRKHEFEALTMPDGGEVGEVVRALESEAEQLRGELEKIAEEVRGIAGKERRGLTIRLAQMETGRRTLATFEKAASGKRVAVVSGYVRARDMGRLEKILAEELPATGVETREPKGDENVPVSIRSNRVFAPGQFLVEMFGVPSYRGFDPSPFITFTFLLFFGFCFGDTVYGVMLVALGLWLARRYRAYEGKRMFFLLLAYGGVSATIVGLLTGSWAADLWTYFGEDTWLAQVVAYCQVTDPLNKPMLALGIALGIGVLNQFYGIVMKMYGEIQQGRFWSAVFDGGLWFLYLPGLMLLGAGLGGVVKAGWVTPTGVTLTVVGALGLVLTQGRHEKTLLGKGLVGLISLYGIMGSYGTTNFVGDTLSYCRLLALGLTTSVVGICFNLIGGMLKDLLPVVGVGLFIVFLLLGHAFNFLVSILGAFVHSARLIFVEFFGRFYDASGERFRPLGASERVRVTDHPK